MSFKLELATYEDIEVLIDIYLKAFNNDPLYPLLYSDLPWQERVRFEASGPKRVFQRQPWVKLYKIVEVETGKIVAWARWHFPRQLTDAEKRLSGDPDFFDVDIPERANKYLCEDLFTKLEVAEHKYIDREKGYFLNYLAVHPEYQGLGLGLRLLKIGLEEADKATASIFLVSTPKGEGLYTKFGFKEIDRFMVDLRLYGGEKEIQWICMRRESEI